MNNTFNVNRFLLLFKKHSIEHAKTYLLSFVVLSGMAFLALCFNSYTSQGLIDRKTQQLTFIFIMLIGGSIFTSISFIELGDKKKAIPFLSLPVSHFEKYLVAWLYSYIIFQLVFIGGFYVVDYIIIHLGTTPPEDRYQQVNIFAMDDKFRVSFVIYALFNGLTLWGAVFFEKMHFIKTAFIFFICLIILVILNNQLLNLFLGKGIEGSVPFAGAGLNDNEHFWRIYPDKSITQYSNYVMGLTALLLWISAYFRLKEKEV